MKRGDGQEETQDRICKDDSRFEICQDAIQTLVTVFEEYQAEVAGGIDPVVDS